MGVPKTAAFVPLTALAGGRPATPDEGPPCHLCPARCCRYFALQIDTPTTPRDHDHIRWYLVHEKVVVWAQDGDWYLEIRTPCRHLQPDNRCGIYETRPEICRTYGMPEAGDGPCEYYTQDGAYDLYFDSAEAFEAWSRPVLARREARLTRRRERRRAARPERREAIA